MFFQFLSQKLLIHVYNAAQLESDWLHEVEILLVDQCLLAGLQLLHLILEIEFNTSFEIAFSSLDPPFLVQLQHRRLLHKHAERLGGHQGLNKLEIDGADLPLLLPLDISIHVKNLRNL